MQNTEGNVGTVRESAFTHKEDAIDKGSGRKSGRSPLYVQRKSFSFSYMWRSGGHLYRFRTGTERRRTRWQLDVRGKERDIETGGGREKRGKKTRKRIRGGCRRDKSKSST